MILFDTLWAFDIIKRMFVIRRTKIGCLHMSSSCNDKVSIFSHLLIIDATCWKLKLCGITRNHGRRRLSQLNFASSVYAFCLFDAHKMRRKSFVNFEIVWWRTKIKFPNVSLGSLDSTDQRPRIERKFRQLFSFIYGRGFKVSNSIRN